MESQALLTVNGKPVSFIRALDYLRATGDDQAFILKILRQHLIETEVESHDQLKIPPEVLEQSVTKFRSDNQIVEQTQLEDWLKEKSLTYDQFREKIETQLKVELLKQALTQPYIEEYFEKNKSSLEQVVLSRIVVAEQSVAQTLKSQIQDEGQPFDQLARQNSLTSDKYTGGRMLPMMLGQLPDNLKEQISVTPPGSLIGPVEVDGGYCVLRIEEFIPASLDDPMKKQIQDQIFEQWLAQKLQQAEVKLHIL